MKTSELTGAALDWAVAKAEGFDTLIKYAPLQVLYEPQGKRSWYVYRPKSNWTQGGPIIERKKIRLDATWNQEDGRHWSARIDSVGGWWQGDTPLIAAMRCYVASKLGDEVEIPKELT